MAHYLSARVTRSREDGVPGPAGALPAGAGGEDHLRWLVRRIADGDPAAFAGLFYRVSGPLATRLHDQIPDRRRVAGIVASTFVEVWWLAGRHVEPGAGIRSWIDEIVERRIADSRPPAPSADAAAVAFFALSTLRAQRSELELTELLGRRLPRLRPAG